MLKTTIQRNNNVNIEYPKLISLLKKNSVGFEPKKSKVFEPDEVRRFLAEADDFHYLAAKVNILANFLFIASVHVSHFSRL